MIVFGSTKSWEKQSLGTQDYLVPNMHGTSSVLKDSKKSFLMLPLVMAKLKVATSCILQANNYAKRKHLHLDRMPCILIAACSIVAARAEKTGSTTPFLFRTYSTRDNTSEPSRTFVKKPLNPGPAANCWIREVARATSAAPTYFKPIEINNWGIDDSAGFLPQIEFIDGGFGTNNPSHEIFKDVKHHLNGNNEVFDTFASFGTGLHPHELKGKLSSLWRQFQELKAHATETQRADDAMKDESQAQEKNDHRKFDFFRFDGGKDLGKVPMDDWSGRRRQQVLTLISTRQTGLETLQTMDRAVDKYLRKSRDAQNDMDKLAEILVRRRRLRTKDKVAWERYACDLRWECSQPDCNAMAETPDAFQAHLNQEHQELTETQAGIKTSFQESRKCWVYKGVSEE
jgi:hypothetical protein